MRVIIVGLREGNDYGGVQQFVMNVYHNIDRQKVQFDFIVEGTSFYSAKEIESLGGRVIYVPPIAENKLQHFIRLFQCIRNERKNHNIAYFHFNSLVMNEAYIFCWMCRYKIYAHAHSTRGNIKPLSYVLHRINRFFVRRNTHQFYACSEMAAKWAFGSDICEDNRYCTVNNAIDCQKFSFNPQVRARLRKEIGIENKTVLGHVGRFSSEKNHIFILQILAEMIKTHPEIVVLFIGNGAKFNQIKKEAERMHLSGHTIFLGMKNNVYDYYQVMDAFLLPSLREGFGMVLIEAQVAGLPCLASKDVIPETVKNTELLDFISLEEPAAVWAQKLHNRLCQTENRHSYAQEIKNSGFDIKDVAKLIQDCFEKNR